MRLSDLKDIDFIDTNFDDTLNTVITMYETTTGRTLAPADPVRLFLYAITKVLIMTQVMFDDAKKMDHLKYARGTFLDHIAVRWNMERIPEGRAVSTVRFSLSSVQPHAVPIPQHTRVTAAGEVYFQTVMYAEVPQGAQWVDVPVECTITGTAGNGYLVGQLNTLVDPIPFISAVTNLTTTAGGSSVETDDSFRERIRLAPLSFSVAGSRGAYQYWAKTANANIIDVYVDAPDPTGGVVEIRPLMVNGELPDPEVLDQVRDTLSPEVVRPLTDTLNIQPPHG